MHPKDKLTIIGGGIVGALEAYFAHLDAKKNGKKIRITVYEKNKNISETTTSHIVPSLTPDEVLSVVPRGQGLVEKLKVLFNEPGGIRVDDVNEVNGSVVTEQFIQNVQKYSSDENNHQERTRKLLELGKLSMILWQDIYDNADMALKNILHESNFHPCREPRDNVKVLHDGYRIDLIYNIPDAIKKANAMKADYEAIGYTNCKILSPSEVMERDNLLADFCQMNSIINEFGERNWRSDAIALWRPGGCIDTQVFLPKLYDYLKTVMGKYTNESGNLKDCFRLKFERNVIGVVCEAKDKKTVINGLRFFGKELIKQNKQRYQFSDYVFCPGETVGMLKKIGFSEPAYAGFAGASLMLSIAVPADKLNQYSKLNHCMEVHQEGVVLAWQARIKDSKIFIGVGGTKAFYGDQKPHKDQEFAINRNILQLNIINDVLPDFVSLALNRETKQKKLNKNDLIELERAGIVERWVGIRAVAYDGFPTLGLVYNSTDGERIANARCTTHLGSGGVSFSPAVVSVSRSILCEQSEHDALTLKVLEYGSSNR